MPTSKQGGRGWAMKRALPSKKVWCGGLGSNYGLQIKVTASCKNFSAFIGWEQQRVFKILCVCKQLKLSVESWNQLNFRLRWVEGLSVEYSIFFLLRMKNVQTDVSHKPCNHKEILIHSRGILTHTPIKRNQKKQKPNSKMQNSWLIIKTWKMSWSKSTFH